MLPGRGVAAELAFSRWYAVRHTALCGLSGAQLLSPRSLQLIGLSLGYATAVSAASLLIHLLTTRVEFLPSPQAFVLRVVDCMLPAAESLPTIRITEEQVFATIIRSAVVADAHPAFVPALRTKWTAAAMMQMRRARGLLDTTEAVNQSIEVDKTRWRDDVAKHGLMEYALPSCGKREASVGQHKRCSACRSSWYCSEEHGALHWKEHKPICRATTAAQQAADSAGAGAA